MIYHLLVSLQPYFRFLRVVDSISFRAMAAFLTALTLSFMFGSWFIEQSKKFFRSSVRQYTPENHQAKNNTPTMGGIFIISIVLATILLWCNLYDPHVLVMITTLVLFAAIGFWDDLSKIAHKKGISELHKWVAQLAAGSVVLTLWHSLLAPSTTLCVPLFKDFNPDLSIFYFAWALFVLVGTCNAVNLTDGLDGLAVSALVPNFATFSIIAYCAGHAIFAHYLHIPFMGTSEVAIIAVILIGACLGFLWYNTYPAQIFMGDVGALSLGAALGMIALLTKQELLLVISGAVFVGETLSVIIQVIGYKLFNVRIFKIAPIHHHYEKLGWPEMKITVRASIITIILCLCALMLLKVR
jgi:phospho-N-acetylmuramoyl-pentapeptide-transferase